MKTLERALRGARTEWRTHVVSAVGSAVAFLCLAFALIALFNLIDLHARWQKSSRLSAYVTDSATPAQVTAIARALRSTPGVDAARYVSSDIAQSELMEAMGGTLIKSLPPEAFPASVEVTLSAATSVQRAQTIANQVRRLPEVETVENYATWTERVGRLVGAASWVSLCLSVIVFFAVIAVVSSSTKLMLERRRTEVSVLRMIGATSAYVRRPFMVEGAVQGGAGSAVALVFAFVIYFFLSQRFEQQLTLLLGMAPRFLPWFVSAALLLLGATLGAAASLLGLRRSTVI